MMITREWVNSEQTVIKVEFPPTWTWDDVYEAKRSVDAMLDQVDHDCALLLIPSANPKIPNNLLSNSIRVFKNSHPRAKLLVFITPNSFLRAVTEMVRKISADIRERARVVETVEQAYEALIDAGYLSAKDRIKT